MREKILITTTTILKNHKSKFHRNPKKTLANFKNRGSENPSPKFEIGVSKPLTLNRKIGLSKP